MSPMSSMRLPLFASWVPISHAKRGPSIRRTLAESSSPQPLTLPMLITCEPGNPADGGMGELTMASLILRV
jgi:hypothetical protein